MATSVLALRAHTTGQIELGILSQPPALPIYPKFTSGQRRVGQTQEEPRRAWEPPQLQLPAPHLWWLRCPGRGLARTAPGPLEFSPAPIPGHCFHSRVFLVEGNRLFCRRWELEAPFGKLGTMHYRHFQFVVYSPPALRQASRKGRILNRAALSSLMGSEERVSGEMSTLER